MTQDTQGAKLSHKEAEWLGNEVRASSRSVQRRNGMQRGVSRCLRTTESLVVQAAGEVDGLKAWLSLLSSALWNQVCSWPGNKLRSNISMSWCLWNKSTWAHVCSWIYLIEVLRGWNRSPQPCSLSGYRAFREVRVYAGTFLLMRNLSSLST